MNFFAFFLRVTALKVLAITPLWFMKRMTSVRLETYESSPSICEAGKQCSYDVWRKYSQNWLRNLTINRQYEYGITDAIILNVKGARGG